LGKRFNEEFMYAKRIPRVSLKEALRREKRGLMDSKTEANSEGGSSTNPRDGGSDDSPLQDGQEPTRGNNRRTVGKKRNPKRGKAKAKRAG